MLSVCIGMVLLGGCSSGGGAPAESAPAPRPLTFDEALVADTSAFEPARGFRAVTESDWSRVTPPVAAAASPRNISSTSWRLSADCAVRFDGEADALASSEVPPFPTRRLRAEGCHGHSGYWQQAGSRVFWWMGLAGGWSAEYYADVGRDSTMLVRRYAMKRSGERTWRADRATLATIEAKLVPDAVAAAPKTTWELTRALRAVGETDWATRPGAGSARTVSGTRWRRPDGCVLSFTAEVLARATATQRLTRTLTSATCNGLKGSWQQVGKRVFWRVNTDSLTGVETYADVVGDTALRTRHFQLSRASTKEAFQALWVPSESKTLTRVKR